MTSIYLKLTIKKINLPERPPNIEAHCVQPKERGQKKEMHDDCCN